MSKHFNFDDFDEQCREAIEGEEHFMTDAQLCLEADELELAERWGDYDLRPGEIGAVIARPTLIVELPDLPETT